MPRVKGAIFTYDSKKQKEYQIFPEAYYDGADVKIYFGDLIIDDIISIDFALHENVTPLYSYASRTYKDINRGNRIVQGQFAIAFREAGYINTILDHIAQINNTEAFKKVGAEPEIATILRGGTRKKWHARMLQRYENLLVEYQSKRKNTEYATAAEAYTLYEKEIWGRRSSADTEHENQTYFNKSRRAKQDYQAILNYTGFDIYLVFGPLPDELVNMQQSKVDISGVTAMSFDNTVKAIRSVQLLTSQIVVMPDNAVAEVFQFIAKDLD